MEKENEIKNVLKVKRKVFTKEESNIIIKKNYNPFTVNKKYLQRKGLCMKKEKDILLEEIEKQLTLEEKKIIKKHTNICIKIYKIGIEKGFNANM